LAIALASCLLFPLLCFLWFFLLAAHGAFFRDPNRIPPPGDAVLSPADGTVSEVSAVFEDRFLKEEAVKIGIFLSVFVPHVNRAPAEGVVRYLRYEPGKFLNALSKKSAQENESNWIGIEQAEKCILMRQIAGAIARRIHCDVRMEQVLTRGERVGIICYGSRAECYVPKRFFRVSVHVGDNMKAGETILGEWLQ
jgi:phosphatidylserine decarboxylase